MKRAVVVAEDDPTVGLEPLGHRQHGAAGAQEAVAEDDGRLTRLGPRHVACKPVPLEEPTGIGCAVVDGPFGELELAGLVVLAQRCIVYQRGTAIRARETGCTAEAMIAPVS